jgi:hypothetical protein
VPRKQPCQKNSLGRNSERRRDKRDKREKREKQSNLHAGFDRHVWRTMAGTFAKATAIGVLPVAVTEIALPHPAGPCFPDSESKNPNGLCLISFRLPRTRAYARLRWRSPFEPMHRSRLRRGLMAVRASAAR